MSPEQFCSHVGIQRTTLEVWVEEGWLVPQPVEAGFELSEIDLARARLIRDLSDAIGVNDEGIGVILHLLDQVHGLRTVLQTVLSDATRSAPRPLPGGDERRA